MAATTLLAALSMSALAGRPWTMPAPHKLRAAHVPRGGEAVVPPLCSEVPGFVVKVIMKDRAAHCLPRPTPMLTA